MRKRRPPKSRRPKATSQKLVVESLDAEGHGVAGDVSLPFALPGEAVDAQVVGRQGTVRERLTSSPDRHSALCPHFGAPGEACGGCTLQHLGEARTTELKKARLISVLSRHFPDASIDVFHRSPAESRRRARFAVTAEGTGFRQYKRDRVIPLRSCIVLHSEIMHSVRPLSRIGSQLGESFDVEVTHAENGLDVALIGLDEERLAYEDRERIAEIAENEDWARVALNGAILMERRMPHVVFDGVPVFLPIGSFLQATEEGQAALIQEVLMACRGSDRVADLFCGLGTFSLPLSSVASVTAWDSVGAAVKALDAAAKRASRNIDAEARDLFRRPLSAQELSSFDAIVFDPPRAGARDQTAAIAEAAPPTIVAVSCNPATLARDAQHFVEGYTLEWLAMVDQFGWSPHIEAVAVFRRRS